MKEKRERKSARFVREVGRKEKNFRGLKNEGKGEGKEIVVVAWFVGEGGRKERQGRKERTERLGVCGVVGVPPNGWQRVALAA